MTSKKSKKLAASLKQAGYSANRLFRAIRSGWTPGCHSTHDAKMYLEDRTSEETKTRGLGRPLQFRIIFSSERVTNSEVLWHECQLEVEDDFDLHDASFQPLKTLSKSPRVTFYITPVQALSREPRAEAHNICLSISEAKRECKLLRLYLHAQQKLECDHVSPGSRSITIHTVSPRMVTLEALLAISSRTRDRSKKMLLKPRLFLALTLASAFFQLYDTPWLNREWSKRSIFFLVPLASDNGHQQPVTALDVSQIDLTHPLISESFENNVVPVDSSQQSVPRSAILELGTMLLEIWHEEAIETYCQSSGYDIGSDYFVRASTAQQWLEASEDLMTPSYFDVAARCIRCLFNGVTINPAWDSHALSQGIVEGVIEPLRAQCRPKQP